MSDLMDSLPVAVNRFEVIDHTAVGVGRAYSKWETFDFNFQFDFQDGGRTLKVFLTDAKRIKEQARDA